MVGLGPGSRRHAPSGQPEPETSSARRSPVAFFLLVFVLAVPFWLMGALVPAGLPLPMRLPVSALQILAPISAAVMLTFRAEGRGGVRRLLRRAVDVRSVRPVDWYAPVLLLVPAIYLLSYWAMRFFGRELPEPDTPALAIPILLGVFLLAAVAEETGWMGYAAPALQSRFGALASAIILGLVWGALHVVPDLQGGRSLGWIIWQRAVYDVALRILIVWLYNSTGRSLFAAIACHDTDNVSVNLFPSNGSHYDPAVTGTITAIVAIIVTVLWGPKTLAAVGPRLRRLLSFGSWTRTHRR